MNRLKKLIIAIQELGFRKLWHYAFYHIWLKAGYYRVKTPFKQTKFKGKPYLPPYVDFPEISKAQRDALLTEADQVLDWHVHLFGGDLVSFGLAVGESELHWTALEKKTPEEDIKLTWEPGRFGWAITLARAYAISGDDRYAEDFWKKTLYFLDVHPPNRGRQWQSAQEVAIRLMCLVFCDRVLAFAPSSTVDNRASLWQAVANHARRIPSTLDYARAQNNNHLLSEAAGLFTAGCYLSGHPRAKKWRKTGWRLLNWAFQNQINESGTYIQHSVNYHRLMLQIALLTDSIRCEMGEFKWPAATLERLGAATRWLWALTDPETGRVPNLGANDGAYIFPLTQKPFNDFRPVLDAAAKAFLDKDIFAQPDLAEMAGWFNLSVPVNLQEPTPQAQDMLRIDVPDGRAFIHTAQFTDRPSHADQLHVDLWRNGVNIALDPGTYLYNALPPWRNALSVTQVHNTLTLYGMDQMLWSGRFLWLDWAQAQVLGHEVDGKGNLKWIKAEHDGYRRLGILHQRTLSAAENGWDIIDEVLPYEGWRKSIHEVRLSWLLPDWEWQNEEKYKLRLSGPAFTFTLEINGANELDLISAGESLYGSLEAQPAWGWIAPNYGAKVPALLTIATVVDRLPIKLESIFRFE